jgi:hypothetical protein
MNKLTVPKIDDQVIFTVADQTRHGALIERFSRVSDLSFMSLDALDMFLIKRPNCHVVFVFYEVVEYLEQALTEGVSPNKALAAWVAETDKLLAVFTRHKKQASVVGAAEALADPHNVLAALAQRTELISAELTQIPPYISTSEVSLPLQSIARLTAERSSQARKLQKKLQGLSVLLPTSQILAPDMDVLFESQKKFATTQTSLIETAIERDRHFDEVKRLAVELSTQTDRLTKKTSDAANMSSLLIKELSQMEKKFEASEHDLAATKAINAALKDEISGVYQSKSWKITEPLRALRRLFRA